MEQAVHHIAPTQQTIATARLSPRNLPQRGTNWETPLKPEGCLLRDVEGGTADVAQEEPKPWMAAQEMLADAEMFPDRGSMLQKKTPCSDQNGVQDYNKDCENNGEETRIAAACVHDCVELCTTSEELVHDLIQNVVLQVEETATTDAQLCGDEVNEAVLTQDTENRHPVPQSFPVSIVQSQHSALNDRSVESTYNVEKEQNSCKNNPCVVHKVVTKMVNEVVCTEISQSELKPQSLVNSLANSSETVVKDQTWPVASECVEVELSEYPCKPSQYFSDVSKHKCTANHESQCLCDANLEQLNNKTIGNCVADLVKNVVDKVIFNSCEQELVDYNTSVNDIAMNISVDTLMIRLSDTSEVVYSKDVNESVDETSQVAGPKQSCRGVTTLENVVAEGCDFPKCELTDTTHKTEEHNAAKFDLKPVVDTPHRECTQGDTQESREENKANDTAVVNLNLDCGRRNVTDMQQYFNENLKTDFEYKNVSHLTCDTSMGLSDGLNGAKEINSNIASDEHETAEITVQLEDTNSIDVCIANLRDVVDCITFVVDEVGSVDDLQSASILTDSSEDKIVPSATVSVTQADSRSKRSCRSKNTNAKNVLLRDISQTNHYVRNLRAKKSTPSESSLIIPPCKAELIPVAKHHSNMHKGKSRAQKPIRTGPSSDGFPSCQPVPIAKDHDRIPYRKIQTKKSTASSRLNRISSVVQTSDFPDHYEVLPRNLRGRKSTAVPPSSCTFPSFESGPLDHTVQNQVLDLTTKPKEIESSKVDEPPLKVKPIKRLSSRGLNQVFSNFKFTDDRADFMLRVPSIQNYGPSLLPPKIDPEPSQAGFRSRKKRTGQMLSPSQPATYYTFQVEDYHHTVTPKGQKMYTCDICAGVYQRSFSLKRHFLRSHINYRHLSARDISNCGIVVGDKMSIQGNKETVISQLDSLANPQDKKTKAIGTTGSSDAVFPDLYRCHTCGICFAHKHALKEHLVNHPSPESAVSTKPYACIHCPASFSHQHNYKKHQSFHSHLLTPPTSTITSPSSAIGYPCSYCYKAFPSPAVRKKHVQQHKKASSHVCMFLCRESFPELHLLREHLLAVHGKEYLGCLSCDERFLDARILKEHVVSQHQLPAKERENMVTTDTPAEIPREVDSEASALELSQKSSSPSDLEVQANQIGSVDKQEVDKPCEADKHESDEFRYMCQLCNKTFTNYVNMCRHRRLAHGTFGKHTKSQKSSDLIISNQSNSRSQSPQTTTPVLKQGDTESLFPPPLTLSSVKLSCSNDKSNACDKKEHSEEKIHQTLKQSNEHGEASKCNDPGFNAISDFESNMTDIERPCEVEEKVHQTLKQSNEHGEASKCNDSGFKADRDFVSNMTDNKRRCEVEEKVHQTLKQSSELSEASKCNDPGFNADSDFETNMIDNKGPCEVEEKVHQTLKQSSEHGEASKCNDPGFKADRDFVSNMTDNKGPCEVEEKVHQTLKQSSEHSEASKCNDPGFDADRDFVSNMTDNKGPCEVEEKVHQILKQSNEHGEASKCHDPGFNADSDFVSNMTDNKGPCEVEEKVHQILKQSSEYSEASKCNNPGFDADSDFETNMIDNTGLCEVEEKVHQTLKQSSEHSEASKCNDPGFDADRDFVSNMTDNKGRYELEEKVHQILKQSNENDEASNCNGPGCNADNYFTSSIVDNKIPCEEDEKVPQTIQVLSEFDASNVSSLSCSNDVSNVSNNTQHCEETVLQTVREENEIDASSKSSDSNLTDDNALISNASDNKENCEMDSKVHQSLQNVSKGDATSVCDSSSHDMNSFNFSLLCDHRENAASNMLNQESDVNKVEKEISPPGFTAVQQELQQSDGEVEKLFSFPEQPDATRKDIRNKVNREESSESEDYLSADDIPHNSSHIYKLSWEKYNFRKNYYSPRPSNEVAMEDLSHIDLGTQIVMKQKQSVKTAKANLSEKTLEESNTDSVQKNEPSSSSLFLHQLKLAQNCNSSVGMEKNISDLDESTTVLSGEWIRPRTYICCTCASKFSDLWELEDHMFTLHYNVWCTYLDIDASIPVPYDLFHRHLNAKGVLSTATLPIPPKVSTGTECTKCGRVSYTQVELHRHMVECAGDFILMHYSPTRRKSKWRPFGSRRRRQQGRRGMKRNIPQSPVKLPKAKYRDHANDAIQQMIANLPAKRASRRVIQFSEDEIKTRSQATIHSASYTTTFTKHKKSINISSHLHLKIQHRGRTKPVVIQRQSDGLEAETQEELRNEKNATPIKSITPSKKSPIKPVPQSKSAVKKTKIVGAEMASPKKNKGKNIIETKMSRGGLKKTRSAKEGNLKTELQHYLFPAEPPYVCKGCRFICDSVAAFDKHAKKCVNRDLCKDESSLRRPVYVCPHCSKKFISTMSLEKHSKTCDQKIDSVDLDMPTLYKEEPLKVSRKKKSSHIPVLSPVVRETTNSEIPMNKSSRTKRKCFSPNVDTNIVNSVTKEINTSKQMPISSIPQISMSLNAEPISNQGKKSVPKFLTKKGRRKRKLNSRSDIPLTKRVKIKTEESLISKETLSTKKELLSSRKRIQLVKLDVSTSVVAELSESVLVAEKSSVSDLPKAKSALLGRPRVKKQSPQPSTVETVVVKKEVISDSPDQHSDDSLPKSKKVCIEKEDNKSVCDIPLLHIEETPSPILSSKKSKEQQKCAPVDSIPMLAISDESSCPVLTNKKSREKSRDSKSVLNFPVPNTAEENPSPILSSRKSRKKQMSKPVEDIPVLIVSEEKSIGNEKSSEKQKSTPAEDIPILIAEENPNPLLTPKKSRERQKSAPVEDISGLSMNTSPILSSKRYRVKYKSKAVEDVSWLTVGVKNTNPILSSKRYRVKQKSKTVEDVPKLSDTVENSSLITTSKKSREKQKSKHIENITKLPDAVERNPSPVLSSKKWRKQHKSKLIEDIPKPADAVEEPPPILLSKKCKEKQKNSREKQGNKTVGSDTVLMNVEENSSPIITHKKPREQQVSNTISDTPMLAVLERNPKSSPTLKYRSSRKKQKYTPVMDIPALTNVEEKTCPVLSNGILQAKYDSDDHKMGKISNRSQGEKVFIEPSVVDSPIGTSQWDDTKEKRISTKQKQASSITSKHLEETITGKKRSSCEIDVVDITDTRKKMASLTHPTSPVLQTKSSTKTVKESKKMNKGNDSESTDNLSLADEKNYPEPAVINSQLDSVQQIANPSEEITTTTKSDTLLNVELESKSLSLKTSKNLESGSSSGQVPSDTSDIVPLWCEACCKMYSSAFNLMKHQTSLKHKRNVEGVTATHKTNIKCEDDSANDVLNSTVEQLDIYINCSAHEEYDTKSLKEDTVVPPAPPPSPAEQPQIVSRKVSTKRRRMSRRRFYKKRKQTKIVKTEANTIDPDSSSENVAIMVKLETNVDTNLNSANDNSSIASDALTELPEESTSADSAEVTLQNLPRVMPEVKNRDVLPEVAEITVSDKYDVESVVIKTEKMEDTVKVLANNSCTVPENNESDMSCEQNVGRLDQVTCHSASSDMALNIETVIVPESFAPQSELEAKEIKEDPHTNSAIKEDHVISAAKIKRAESFDKELPQESAQAPDSTHVSNLTNNNAVSPAEFTNFQNQFPYGWSAGESSISNEQASTNNENWNYSNWNGWVNQEIGWSDTYYPTNSSVELSSNADQISHNPSFGAILGSAHQVLEDGASEYASSEYSTSGQQIHENSNPYLMDPFGGRQSLEEIQTAMGATDEEMAMLQQLGQGSLASHEFVYDNNAGQSSYGEVETLQPLDNPDLIDLDNQASNSETFDQLDTLSHSSLTHEDANLGGRILASLESESLQPSALPTPKLLSVYEKKEMVCPVCNRHFLGLQALETHISWVHKVKDAKTRIFNKKEHSIGRDGSYAAGYSSLLGREPGILVGSSAGVVLGSAGGIRGGVLRAAAGAAAEAAEEAASKKRKLACFVCKELYSDVIALNRHIAQLHIKKKGDTDKDGGLKSQMSSALGGLLDRAINNIILGKTGRNSNQNIGTSNKAILFPVGEKTQVFAEEASQDMGLHDERHPSDCSVLPVQEECPPRSVISLPNSTKVEENLRSVLSIQNVAKIEEQPAQYVISDIKEEMSQQDLPSPGSSFNCHHCSERFASKSSRNQHIAEAHKVEDLPQPPVELVLDRKGTFVMQEESQERLPLLSSPAIPLSDQIPMSAAEQFAFSQSIGPILPEPPSDELQCPICLSAMKHYHSLIRHIKTQHCEWSLQAFDTDMYNYLIIKRQSPFEIIRKKYSITVPAPRTRVEEPAVVTSKSASETENTDFKSSEIHKGPQSGKSASDNSRNSDCGSSTSIASLDPEADQNSIRAKAFAALRKLNRSSRYGGLQTAPIRGSKRRPLDVYEFIEEEEEEGEVTKAPLTGLSYKRTPQLSVLPEFALDSTQKISEQNLKSPIGTDHNNTSRCLKQYNHKKKENVETSQTTMDKKSNENTSESSSGESEEADGVNAAS